MRFGDAGRDGAHANFGDELDADAGAAIGILQVVNQLGEVFDRVNVVVRRWRDETNARCGVTHLRDPRINFAAGQLAAFAWLGALGHLNLQLLRVAEIIAGHSETARGDLLDGAVFGIAIGLEGIAGRVLAAFTGVAFAAETVHGDRKRFVRFLADRAVAHGAGLETLHDGLDRLDFLDGDRRIGPAEIQQAAQRAMIVGLLVDEARVILEDLIAAGPAGELQFVDRLRVE